MWRVTVCSRVLLVLHFWLTTNAASHVLADRGLMLRIREFAKVNCYFFYIKKPLNFFFGTKSKLNLFIFLKKNPFKNP